MRKILLIMITVMLFPMLVFAETYEIEDLGLEIYFDDTKWNVVTKDNMINNSFFEKYESNPSVMKKFFEDNFIYLYAITENKDEEIIEFFVRSKLQVIGYKDQEINEFGSEITEALDIDDYEVYENNYKFVLVNYYDSENRVYSISYYIIINSQYYVFTAQKATKFSQDEQTNIKEIVDSIVFKEIEDNEPIITIDWLDVFKTAFDYGVGAAIAYIYLYKTNKLVKKDKTK